MRLERMALLGVLAGGPVQAADDPIVPDPIHAPTEFRDDTPAGHYTNWRDNLSCGTNAVRAVFRITKMYGGTKWASVMKIGLGEEQAKFTDEEMRRGLRRITLQIGFLEPPAPPETAVMTFAGNDEIQRNTYDIDDPIGRPVPVEIRWDEKGNFTLKVDGRSLKDEHLTRAPTSVDFVLSGVDGEIGGIEVGRIGPPSAACPQAPQP